VLKASKKVSHSGLHETKSIYEEVRKFVQE